MNNQDQAPTIAELWKEADGLIRLSIPHLEKLASPDYQVNEERRPFYTNQLASCNERLQYLRQQLVEMCEKVFGLEIREISFGGVIIPKICNGCEWDYFDAEQAGEFGDAMNFMAWELQQREKEASGD